MRRARAGARVHVHAFRRDELLELDVVLKAAEHDVAYFTLRSDDAADVRRAAWLTPHKTS